jgi:hypothetical protein
VNLRRIRWGCRAVLGVGVGASIVGNVLHARNDLISQVISAWPPIALLLTIELISKVPVHSATMARARIVAAAVIAGIAAWVSYWHMAAVAANYGETSASPYLLPISVDGLVVVAWICLAELAGRIRETEGTNQGGSDGLGKGQDGDAEADVGSDHQTDAGQREESTAAADRQEEVAVPAGVKLTPVRKRPPTSEAKVVRAHEKNPAASNAELARRVNLSPETVKRYRPPRPEPAQSNGHIEAGTEERSK